MVVVHDKAHSNAQRLLLPIMACCVLLGCEGSMGLDNIEALKHSPTIPGDEETENPEEQPAQQVPPSASLHRLNRLEYNNSVRDLLGTTLRPADDFPPDASVGGFDNSADALSITPTLMDRYFEAARVVIDDAFADRPFFQEVLEEDDARLVYGVDRDSNRIGGIVRLRGGNVQTEVEVPKAGPHTVVVRAQGTQNGGAAIPRLRLAIAGQNFDFDVSLTMQDASFPIDLPEGRHAVVLQFLNFEEDAPNNRGNDVLFDRLLVRSDEIVPGPARTKVMTCEPVEPQDSACASTIVGDFARLAWRRPLTQAENASLDGLYGALRAEGESPEEAIKLSLRAILTSPKFLYRYRTLADSDSGELLDPYVLASRLSYFVWSSTPDERLLTAAADGTLSTRDGIRQTVAWMLQDPRATALADGFAEQWLDLRHLYQASPSSQVYPEFNEQVREAMVRESKLFFLDYLDNGAPVASMLTPSFAYRDATLASHLGLEAPAGDGFERFEAGPGDRRGVLALSAWLTSRSDSEHPSPIRRGAWIADNMLCSPVPPPPAGLEVGELPEAEGGLTVREQLELHRSEPACAGCHELLDVVGIGLQVYDGVGRYVEDPTVDSTGQIPGGAQFRGADQLAQVLDHEAFVTCVSSKLFSYAIGRTVNARDRESLSAVEQRAGTMTLPEVVTEIVLTPAFSRPVPLE